jgi:hypothetical protein
VEIREKLNKNPLWAGLIAVVCLGILGAVVFWPKEEQDQAVINYSGKQFFTVDDGATYFVADVTNIPPFTHEGKTAYRVKVYTCEDGKEIVSHLERYNEAALKRIRDMDGGTIKHPVAALQYLDGAFAMEVKKPGDNQWLRRGHPQYDNILMATCPDGSPVTWLRAK